MYTLRLPFRLPLGREIMVSEEVTEVGALKFSLERHNQLYVLNIDGFPSENEAKNYINNVWAGLMWVLLQSGLSSDVELKAQEIKYAEDPYQAAKNLEKSLKLKYEGPVDCLIDGARPAVYLSERKIATITAGEPTLVLTVDAEDILGTLIEGASFQRSDEVVKDKKLRVALALYGAYFTEFSSNARFLTLVMAFEALATGVRRTQLVLDLLDQWKIELEKLLKTVGPDTDDASSLEDLHRELLFRREDSIRRRIQYLVRTTLRDHGDEDAEDVAKEAVKMYDLRSTLLHTGWLEPQVLRKATSDTKRIVERILQILFVKKSGKSEDGNA